MKLLAKLLIFTLLLPLSALAQFTASNNGSPLGSAGMPPACADSSGSGTAQSCNTSPKFTPAAGDHIIYTTTTANTGTGLTINVNSLGAKSVAKWQTTTTLAANDVRANTEILMKYDGTNWEMDSIGNAPSQTIATGTAALGTSAISSAACATVVTVSATGVASTDTITWTPNASIKAVTGYAPATTGGLSIAAYPTSGNVNFDICNWSASSVTPGAVTLNWRVTR